MSRSKMPTASTCVSAAPDRSLPSMVNILDALISSLHLESTTFYQGPIKHITRKPEKPTRNCCSISRPIFSSVLPATMILACIPPGIGMPLASRSHEPRIDARLIETSAFLDRGFYRSSLDCATALIDKQCLQRGDLAYAYCFRGIARSFLNQPAGAIQDIDRGLQLNPDLVGKENLYGIRATSLFRLNKYEAALLSINKSLAAEPSAIAFRLRGLIFLRLKKYQNAKSDFTRAMAYADCPADTGKLCEKAALKAVSQKSHPSLAKHGTRLKSFTAENP